MTMYEMESSGQVPHRVTLGPVEKVIAALAVAAMVGVPPYLWQRAEARADKQDETLRAVDTRTQVMANQMTALATQLADIPALRTALAENKVQIQRNSEDIAELRSMRGLK